MTTQNSFELLAQFKKQARNKFTPERIQAILKDATSGDRDHLEAVLYVALSDLEDEKMTCNTCAGMSEEEKIKINHKCYQE